MKFKLPLNYSFFINRNELIHRFIKNLKTLYKEDIFGYSIIATELNNKKLKFIKKTYSPYSIKLNPNKNYAIFINYNLKSHILLNNKLLSKNKNIILFLKNELDNGIWIYEMR